MAPPHMRRPAALPRGEPCENDDAGKQVDSFYARGRQVRVIGDLEIIADWKEDLTRRMARGQLILENIGLSTERHDELVAEARAFMSVCRVMTDRIAGSLVDDGHEERRAA